MRLLLIDSASLYYRAFYGVKHTVTTPDGRPANAVRGFVDMISALITSRAATHVVACWDEDWRPAFRTELLPEYKAQRLSPSDPAAEETPDELSVQVPMIESALQALGIPRVGAAGFEADDVMATLATEAAAQRGKNPQVPLEAEIEVVTGDRDLLQLVDDRDAIRVVYTGRGMAKLQIFDQTLLSESYGVPTGAAYAAAAVLRGDASDGLTGVAGIGEKTAAQLITKLGSLEAVLQAADAQDPALTPRLRTNVLAAQDYIRRAEQVVTCVRTVQVPALGALMERAHIHNFATDESAVNALIDDLGLASSVQRLRKAIAG